MKKDYCRPLFACAFLRGVRICIHDIREVRIFLSCPGVSFREMAADSWLGYAN